ncbi:thrombospondin type-1 domain-containing protein 1 [Brachionichthys hirsutus]|uniref:thrombospondin type-1 domain-containing protein 1 n=1 Tax=Brachionichthys hirsutus TaxID=412623 RepID=UPI0036049DC3
MTQAVSLLPFLLALLGYAFAGLNVWPSFHMALSSFSVFVDFSTKTNGSAIRSSSLSLVNMETNATLLTRTLPSSQSTGRVEFNCSCFLYAGTFRFLLRQTRVSATSHVNGSEDRSRESTTWWWSSELQVQWPTFHIAVGRAGNHSGSFQVGISMNDHFQACSHGIDSSLFLEVSYLEFNQIGRSSINKVRFHTRRPIKPVRSQSLELACAFPFTERDFIRVALQSPHAAQDVKSSGPLYLARIFSYKLLVESSNAYRKGCEGTMTVKLITPPCAHVNGKVLLYKDAGVGTGMDAGGTALQGFGAEEPTSPPVAFNWLTQGENETEFNCSVFYPGRNKYCFRFVFNYSRSPSPAQTCLVVHRGTESLGPWQPWGSCSVSCGEGVRERVRECLLPSTVEGVHCTGTMKKQSVCSLEDCVVLPVPSPSFPPVLVGFASSGGNIVMVAGISICLTVVVTTVVVVVWRKLCRTPQLCSSVRRGSMHSPGGRKLSDEASICGHSLQRPNLSDGRGPLAGMAVGSAWTDNAVQSGQPLSKDPERLSPTGQKMLPTIFGYRLAQEQLKEMKKKGLKEATQVYHVSSSPVNDTLLGISASPTNSPIPTLAPGIQDNTNPAALFSEAPAQTSGVTAEMSPSTEPIGPRGGSSKWHDRTAGWVEMVERGGLASLRGEPPNGAGYSFHKNPNFRRTASFNDPKPPPLPSAQARPFRERSMTQVGSRTLPEGTLWSKGRWERQPYRSYPIPEHGALDWAECRAQINDHKKPWAETAVPLHSSELKHTGTNTNGISAFGKDARAAVGVVGPSRSQAGVGEGISGIGGPAVGPSLDRAAWAEQNWNRRGPSPIQRNILARKLKEAQSCSGVKGRQRSSTFSVPSYEQRNGRCHSLPMSGDDSSGVASPYVLSEAEKRMLDLDLSSAHGREEESNTASISF